MDKILSTESKELECICSHSKYRKLQTTTSDDNPMYTHKNCYVHSLCIHLPTAAVSHVDVLLHNSDEYFENRIYFTLNTK